MPGQSRDTFRSVSLKLSEECILMIHNDLTFWTPRLRHN
jgi:hypothetical protein